MIYIAMFQGSTGPFEYTLRGVKNYHDAEARAKRLATSFGWKYDGVFEQ